MEDFTYTFVEQTGFIDDISSWDVSSAKSMDYMFQGTIQFNQVAKYERRFRCQITQSLHFIMGYNQYYKHGRNVYKAVAFNQALDS